MKEPRAGLGAGFWDRPFLGQEKLETTAIYTEVTIRQLIEVHARCHPSAQLPANGKTPESPTT